HLDPARAVLLLGDLLDEEIVAEVRSVALEGLGAGEIIHRIGEGTDPRGDAGALGDVVEEVGGLQLQVVVVDSGLGAVLLRICRRGAFSRAPAPDGRALVRRRFGSRFYPRARGAAARSGARDSALPGSLKTI